MASKSQLPKQSLQVISDEPYAKFFQQDSFCYNLTVCLDQEFSVVAHIKHGICIDGREQETVTIDLSGTQVQVTLAYDKLQLFLSTSLVKKVFDKNKGKIKPMHI
jgi:hypothetical protein